MMLVSREGTVNESVANFEGKWLRIPTVFVGKVHEWVCRLSHSTLF